MMVISLNPFVVAGSRRFNQSQFMKSLAVTTSAGDIIFGFEFHGKQIVAMDYIKLAFARHDVFDKHSESRLGHEACAHTGTFHAEQFCATANAAAGAHCYRHICLRQFKCLRTK
ncbi:hypothetical protein [Bradyrhizobium sp. LTSPM299]|uniref:hypothetical protein n=1 Tax=Bradyrhizobium sp. LTSPM299 TaxID=1619233 RepID=UPI001FD8B724|nr:hypothetical protein [Bradyrhizobium sp. LTSPM299]